MKLPTNPGKLSLAKGRARFVSVSFPKLANQETKDPPDRIILDTSTLLSFVFVNILLAKAFLILVVCLAVKDNSCGNSSYSKFFLFILNIVPVLFFAADFNSFNFNLSL